MPRPPRIEFENAWYHIMNRGAGRRIIFPHDDARLLFLELLSKTSDEFRLQIHAYCLMDNHYHLLVQTPHANLNLAMQKLASVYTRRYNRLAKTDGPLFRGRYKAILIAQDAYLAQVSRYIHRNPVEAKLVQCPRDFKWSSYSAYCDSQESPRWLLTSDVIRQISSRNDKSEYLQFVENPLAPSMHEFYQSRRLPGVLGNKEARRLVENRASYAEQWHPEERPTLSNITEIVAQEFGVARESIMIAKRGQQNTPRSVSMDLAQRRAKFAVSDIAAHYGVGPSGVTQSISRLRKTVEEEPKLADAIRRVEQVLVGA